MMLSFSFLITNLLFNCTLQHDRALFKNIKKKHDQNTQLVFCISLIFLASVHLITNPYSLWGKYLQDKYQLITKLTSYAARLLFCP